MSLTRVWLARTRPGSSTLGWVEHVNLADGAMVRQMFPVLLTFYGSVYSNMKARGVRRARTCANPARREATRCATPGGPRALAARRHTCAAPIPHVAAAGRDRAPPLPPWWKHCRAGSPAR